MPLKKFSANLLKGDEVLVKLKGAGSLQFRAAEGSLGADVVTKTAKVTKVVKAQGLAGAGKVAARTGKGTLPMAKGTVGGVANGTAGKAALGAKAGTAASAKTAAVATGTIWKGAGVSLGLGLGLGTAGPVILGGAVLGLGYYLYKNYYQDSTVS
jgi:hypothetical protein